MRKKIPHVKAGDMITADLLNAIIDRIEPFSKLSVSGPFLSMLEGPHGKTLNLAFPRPMWARLSGSGNPYSWQMVRWDDTAGAWVDHDAVNSSGDNAYELNGATGLGGKIAELKWTTAGDYRFQARRYGPPPPCETGRICVTVVGASCAIPLTGVSVTVEDADGVVIGMGTTSGSPGKVCFDIPTAGTYTVTSHVPGVTDQTATVNAVCDVDNNVTLTYPANSIGRACISYANCDCDGSHPTGAEAGITGTGEASVTLDPGTGQGCVILGVGSYSATISASSGYTETRPFSVTACTTVTVAFISISAMAIAANSLPAGCTMTYTFLTGATGSCSLTSPTPSCCVTFGSPVPNNTPGSFRYKSSGPTWNNVQFLNIGCYSTSSPFVMGFGNLC